jgi:GntR family transcriptional repressor for pyruvate dehydrogenase complex
MSTTFDPIVRHTVSEAVRDRIREGILAGSFVPGEALPSERALCEELGVARTSVREAMQWLASAGLTERRGNRTHVVERLPDLRLHVEQRALRLRDVFEVRRLIELPMAELVAERATQEERTEIERIARRFRRTMSIAAFRPLDRDFHWAVARASHNAVLAEVYLKVLEGLFESDEFAALLYAKPNKAAVAKIVASATEAHQAIAAAIMRGDQVATVEAVEAHLRDVENRMLAQLV